MEVLFFFLVLLERQIEQVQGRDFFVSLVSDQWWMVMGLSKEGV